MTQITDFEFAHHGHRIHVHRETVPETWMVDVDTVFEVSIDENQTSVPGLWKAHEMAGNEGVELVIKAFLDGSRETIH